MKSLVRQAALCAAIAFGLASCGGASEPSEGQMRDAVQYFIDHELGANGNEGNNTDAKIAEFTKGKCAKPEAEGVNCTFTMKIASSNPMAAAFLNMLQSGQFYKDKDSGKWRVRIA